MQVLKTERAQRTVGSQCSLADNHMTQAQAGLGASRVKVGLMGKQLWCTSHSGTLPRVDLLCGPFHVLRVSWGQNSGNGRAPCQALVPLSPSSISPSPTLLRRAWVAMHLTPGLGAG